MEEPCFEGLRGNGNPELLPSKIRIKSTELESKSNPHTSLLSISKCSIDIHFKSMFSFLEPRCKIPPNLQRESN